jgi:hypothetical protein
MITANDFMERAPPGAHGLRQRSTGFSHQRLATGMPDHENPVKEAQALTGKTLTMGTALEMAGPPPTRFV